MDTRRLWSRILLIVGGISMVSGAVDPLEGSITILIGCGLVAFGTYLGQPGSRLLTFSLWSFGLIVFGVTAMFWLSALGGIGGHSQYSMWWGLLILPYPIGWIMGVLGLLVRAGMSLRRRMGR